MVKWIVGLAALTGGAVCASTAIAADQPRYAPPAAWVKALPISKIPVSTDGSPLQILLQDSQSRFGPDGDEFYAETAAKILSPQGLAAMANISNSWNPETDTLILHRLNIIRGDQVIDMLAAGKKVTVLRRETNLDIAMLDGALTATVQPEGLQIGDIVDMAMTLQRHDPVFQGRSEGLEAMRHVGVAGRVYIRNIWPGAKPMRWRTTEGMAAPAVAHTGAGTELLVDETNVVSPKPPRAAPSRFADVGELEISQFQTWAEVSALMAPLYAKAASLGPDSPLRAEIEKIRRASDDPKIRTEAALRLVQDQVHYVFLGMNSGGFVPADADLTWSRRFGDCKGKTVLLLALLHALGVEAQPALVSTELGDGLDERLPQLRVFDHVFVRVRIAGKVYWLDGTRAFDRDLNDIPLPDFHWVLPVQSGGAQLEKVEPKPFAEPAFESVERLDASGGLDAPAPAHAEQIFRGDSAVVWHVSLDSVGRTDAERNMREYWRKQIPWIDAKTVDFAYDETRHLMRLSMDGAAKMDWTKNAGVRDFDIGDSNLGFRTSFKREPGPHSGAPYSVNFPDYNKWTVVITLPRRGEDFRLMSAADVDTTIAGRRYQRQTRMDGGVVTMVAQEQSLAPEFPAAQAEAAGVALRNLANFDVTVRGPDRTDVADDDGQTAQPADAAGFNLRGVAFLRQRDYDRAIADFSEAARLEPKASKHVYDRGAAHYEKGEDALALDDFTLAIRLNPQDVLAYLARADLYLGRGDQARAKKDFEQALVISPDDPMALFRRASAYEQAGLFEQAVRGFDVLIAHTPNPAQHAAALNNRCWARAEWGRELEDALADCNAALELTPGAPQILDSRGFVRLRLGQYDKAIVDYDAALQLAPRRAPSLFGRGLTKLREGHATAAAVDIAAARALAPGIDAEFSRYGVKAPADLKP